MVNELRRRLGPRTLEDETGLDDLGHGTDSIFIPQLVPEIMEGLTGYTKIILVEAHVSPDLEDLGSAPVLPEYVSSPFTHHMTPSAFLAFLKTLYRSEPEAHLVSIRGHDFDFTRALSPRTGALVGPAADAILELTN